MIWVVFTVLLLGTALVLAPAFLDGGPADADAELSSYFAQIDALDARTGLSDAERAAARARLERQVLARRTAAPAGRRRPLALAGTLGALALGGLLTYLPLGRPDLWRGADTVAAQPDDLVAQLEQRLATDRADDPVGWRIYANVLLEAGRFGEAAAAMERAIALGDTAPELADALERTRALAAQQAAMGAMSEGERQDAIRGMVDGLAARLDAQPDDPQGWTRLIRARLVLGDTEAAESAAARVREVFADRPELRDAILRDGGYPQQRNNP